MMRVHLAAGLSAIGIVWGASSFSLAATDSPKPFEKNAVLTGIVSAAASCGEASDRRPPEVWISIGKILLYQVQVPLKGGFEFHLVPGKYDLLVTSSNGCMDQAQVILKPEQVASVNLKLAADRAPAGRGK